MYDPRAAYFVHWTLGQVPKHGAHIDLIIGEWAMERPQKIEAQSAWNIASAIRVRQSW
jgi:hypothetical protein